MKTFNRLNKPKLKSEDLIAKMRDEKGILFNIMDETKAETYLLDRNNYLRTTAYRKNYMKYADGPKKGKYIGLEFAYLAELSTLDMYLREILFQMTVDVEHALKTALLKEVEKNDEEDGYHIVDLFLKENPRIKSSIAYKADSSFTSGLIGKYFDVKRSSDGSLHIKDFDCPIWVLVETLSFGDFIQMYNFYYNQYPTHGTKLNKGVISPVRTLRNACAHNSCILFDLRPYAETTKPAASISQFVSSVPGIGKRERQKKLSCRPMLEISMTPGRQQTAEKKYVSPKVRARKMNDLHEFVHGRMQKHAEWFQSNQTISTTFGFLVKVVDAQI